MTTVLASTVAAGGGRGEDIWTCNRRSSDALLRPFQLTGIV